MRFQWFPVLMLSVWLGLTGRLELSAADSPADRDSLVQFLPAGALGTIEVVNLASTIDRIEESDALKSYLKSLLFDDALKTDPVRKAMAGKAIFEAQLGMSLSKAAKTYLGHRIAVGVYPPVGGLPPDGVLVVRVNEAADLTRLLDKLAPLMTLAGDQVSISDHDRGGKALKFKDGHLGVINDRWLVLSKNHDLVGQTLSNLAQSQPSGLADEPAWKTMAKQVGLQHTVQICMNLAKFTELHGKRIVPEKLDNPLISLIYGGVAELAARSPYLGLTLDLRNDGFRLQAAVSGTAAELDAAHRGLLLDPSQPLLPLLPDIQARLAAISFSRNLADWYKAREQLLEARLLPEFDKFETGIATFLPGKDFAEDVLPLLTGRVALVSAPQEYSYLDGKPGVQLPAFGLVIELAKPQEGSDILNLIGQTILTIRNLEASKQKQQPWVQSSESYHGVQINFARYIQRPKGDQLATVYNFQPATALVGNRFIFSSSLGLCRSLVDSMSGSAPLEASAVEPAGARAALPNFVQEFSPAIAAQLLEANAAVIHARNIQNGKTAEQSTRELEGLCLLLRHLTTVRLDTVQYADRVQVELHGGWK